MEFKNWLIESKKKRDNTRAKVKGREKRQWLGEESGGERVRIKKVCIQRGGKSTNAQNYITIKED